MKECIATIVAERAWENLKARWPKKEPGIFAHYR